MEYDKASAPPPYGYAANAPPQQQSYQIPAPAPVQVQVPATTVVVMSPSVGPGPVSMTCPSCQASIVTTVENKAGLLTWLVCGGLALLGCFLCCCIPFCVDSCQDVYHSCPNCKRPIGVYKRM